MSSADEALYPVSGRREGTHDRLDLLVQTEERDRHVSAIIKLLPFCVLTKLVIASFYSSIVVVVRGQYLANLAPIL